MDFWSRMLSGIADTILPKDLEEDALLLQMEEALREEKELWRARQNFLEPGVARSFQNKWRSAYYSAKKKSTGIRFSLGLSGRKLRSLAPQFIETYERLPSKLQAFNEQQANQKVAYAATLILPVEGKMLDDQQMRCITKEVRNHLVLAGAGTGKTTTIVGYVKYLLKRKIGSSLDNRYYPLFSQHLKLFFEKWSPNQNTLQLIHSQSGNCIPL